MKSDECHSLPLLRIIFTAQFLIEQILNLGLTLCAWRQHQINIKKPVKQGTIRTFRRFNSAITVSNDTKSDESHNFSTFKQNRRRRRYPILFQTLLTVPTIQNAI